MSYDMSLVRITWYGWRVSDAEVGPLFEAKNETLDSMSKIS